MTAPNPQTKAPRIADEDVRRFVDLVPRGAEHAVTAEELVWRMGIVPRGLPTDDNHRRLIRAYRQAAADVAEVLVLGGNDGYFIPETMDEIRDAHGRRVSQATQMLADVKAEEDLARRMFRRIDEEAQARQMTMTWGAPSRSYE